MKKKTRFVTLYEIYFTSQDQRSLVPVCTHYHWDIIGLPVQDVFNWHFVDQKLFFANIFGLHDRGSGSKSQISLHTLVSLKSTVQLFDSSDQKYLQKYYAWSKQDNNFNDWINFK